MFIPRGGRYRAQRVLWSTWISFSSADASRPNSQLRDLWEAIGLISTMAHQENNVLGSTAGRSDLGYRTLPMNTNHRLTGVLGSLGNQRAMPVLSLTMELCPKHKIFVPSGLPPSPTSQRLCFPARTQRYAQGLSRWTPTKNRRDPARMDNGIVTAA